MEEHSKIKVFKKSDEKWSTHNKSINYVPFTMQERVVYSNLLSNELHLRGLGRNSRMDLENKRSLLLKHVEAEEMVRELNRLLKHSEGNPAALYLLKQAIPCILHLEI